jgi:membrane protein implicated in regulation of membrane protease activity
VSLPGSNNCGIIPIVLSVLLLAIVLSVLLLLAIVLSVLLLLAIVLSVFLDNTMDRQHYGQTTQRTDMQHKGQTTQWTENTKDRQHNDQKKDRQHKGQTCITKELVMLKNAE